MYYLAYYLLIGSALTISLLLLRRGQHRFLTLSVLMAVTLVIELVAHRLIALGFEFVWLYHLYCPLEYALLVLYLRGTIAKPIFRRVALISIFLFGLASLTFSWYFYRYSFMPGINIGVESILLFTLCTYVLFNLNVDDARPIFLQTDFWICTGFLLFFGVCAFFFGVYTPLFRLNESNALALFGRIVAPLNLLLYLFINFGLICSLPRKKFTTPSL